MPLTYQDPVHGEFTLPDRFRTLIESRSVNRLRNIKQLGLTVSRYPGAVHSRFEHMLGTAAVANDLLEALGCADDTSINRVTLACLLSEVGITPLSYSTRSVFQSLGLDKDSIRSILYSYDLSSIPGVSALQGGEVIKPGFRVAVESWDAVAKDFGAFAYMDFVKLASTVDYVMRDAHYCGRAHGGFDYRRFRVALSRISEADAVAEMFDELQALHRAVHALNAVYGDADRRVLTVVMNRLATSLIKTDVLRRTELTEPAALVEMDDDQFLGLLIEATERLTGPNLRWCTDALSAVIERAECEYFPLERTPGDEGASTEDIAARVAKDKGTEPWRVALVGSNVEDGAGFRVFGSEFTSLSAAMESDHFSECTGLDAKRIRSFVTGPERIAIVRT